MKTNQSKEPEADTPVEEANTIPARRNAVQHQFHVIGRLVEKVGKVTRHVLTSPAIRSHVISIIQSEGLPGILRRLRRMRSNLKRATRTVPHLQAKPLSYEAWSKRFDTPSEIELDALLGAVAKIKIVVLLLADQSDSETLTATLNSLEAAARKPDSIQLLCMRNVPDYERSAMQSQINASSVSPNKKSCEQEITDSCTILIRVGDRIRPHTLALMAGEFVQSPELAFVYADEARCESGKLKHWFKPDYSPLMARSGRLLTGVVAFNGLNNKAASCVAALVADVDAAENNLIDWTIHQQRATIGHLPHIVSITEKSAKPLHDVTPPLSAKPVVSIIIPTRNFWSVLRPCLDSLKNTDWPVENLDVIVVDNGSDEAETLAGLASREDAGEIRIIRHDHPFNWSELNNVGAEQAKGSVLIFLNNDIEVISPNWLKKLVTFATLPQAGAVGCKLLYPDRTVQHGGVVVGIQGSSGHAHLLIDRDDEGYNGLANTNREVSAVTGACIAIERTKFNIVGGFNEDFQVAFNDTAFCVSLSNAGFDNIYVADVMMIHHESKSRGYDTTLEKIERNRLEQIRFWQAFRSTIREDRFYSPNLSYEQPYKISTFPRRKPAWDAFKKRRYRVLILSETHAIGHGVPVIIEMQVKALTQAGFDVFIGGPKSQNDFSYEGRPFFEIHDHQGAALAAISLQVHCVIAHTPPFFSTVRLLGKDISFIAFDHGEPPAEWFSDSNERNDLKKEKEVALSMVDCACAISETIRRESNVHIDEVIPHGNSHLGTWSELLSPRRTEIRKNYHFDDLFIVMNVCRFHRGERQYKGTDVYIQIKERLLVLYPTIAPQCIFLLCGKGTNRDIAEIETRGIKVLANLDNQALTDIYIASDAYINFSRWEGYNLGIAQALAMGLPTFASDIPAHRAFGIEVSNDIDASCAWIAEQVKIKAQGTAIRNAKVWQWDEKLRLFVDVVRQECNRKAKP